MFIRIKLCRLAVVLTALLAVASTSGCKQGDSSPEQPEVEAGSAEKVWGMAKECSEGSCKIDELETEFNKLSDADLEKLAEKRDGENSFTLYLAKSRLYKKSSLMLAKLFEKITPAQADKQLDDNYTKKPFDLMLDAQRPSDETVAELHDALAVIVGFKPVMVNELKKANAFDAEIFNSVFALIASTKAANVATNLDATSMSAWLNWAMSNKATSKPNFKQIYAHQSDATKKADMRNKLLADLYATPADLVAMLDASDPWGLVTALNADTYKLDQNPVAAGPAHEGSLLYVLMKRSVQDAAIAANTVALDTLRTFATPIRARLTDVTYLDLATVKLSGGTPGTEVKTVLDADLTAAKTGYSYYYLDLPNPEQGLMEAVAQAAVTPAVLEDLYDNLIDNNDKAAALAALPVAPGDKFLHLLIAKDPDANALSILTKFLNGVHAKAEATLPGSGPAAVEAQIADAGAGAAGNPLKRLLAVGHVGGVSKADMVNKLVDGANGAALDTLSAAELQARVDAQYAAKATPAPNNGKDAFKAMYAKVNAANQKIMRDKLLNLAYAVGMVDTKALLDDIVAVGDDYGLGVGLSLNADVYDLIKRPPTVGNWTGTLLFVLANRAIEENTAATPNAYTDLGILAAKIKTKLGAAPYITHVTTDTSTGTVQGGDTAFSVLLADMVTTPAAAARKHGLPQQTLDLVDPTPGNAWSITPALVAAAADVPHAALDNKALRWLYDNSIATDATGAQAALLAPKVGVVSADRFIHRLVSRKADADTLAILTDFLAKVELTGVGAALVQITTKGAATTKRPLNLLVETARIARLNPAVDSAAELTSMINLLLVSKNNSIKELADFEEHKKVLNAALSKDVRTLKRIFRSVDNTKVNYLARWCASHITDTTGDGVATVASIFKKTYNARPAAQQIIMHNTLVAEAYKVGRTTDVQAAVDKVADLITNNFFDEVTLKLDTYDPFAVGKTSALLYAVLAKAKTTGALTQPIVNGIAVKLKAKFTGVSKVAEWKAYLDTDNNVKGFGGVFGGVFGGKKIEEDLVRPDAGANQLTSRTWLDW